MRRYLELLAVVTGRSLQDVIEIRSTSLLRGTLRLVVRHFHASRLGKLLDRLDVPHPLVLHHE